MSFLYPEFLLLLLPAAWIFYRLHRPRPDADAPATPTTVHDVHRLRNVVTPSTILRAALLVLAIVVLAVPLFERGTPGADLVVLVDRSASMPPGAHVRASEIVHLAEAARERGDRLGIVTFGATAAVERLPSHEATFGTFDKIVDREASDLAAGLDAALGLVPKDRPGRILVFSDGESTGRDPLATAWDATARGHIIDFRHAARPTPHDIAVAGLQLPPVVRPGEAFQFSGDVIATRPATIHWALRRGDIVISEGDRELRRGRNRLRFRDRLARAGIVPYTLEIRTSASAATSTTPNPTGPIDGRPENDLGRGIVRVEGPGAVLLVSHDGEPGNLGRALVATGRPLRAMKPGATPVTMELLDDVRCVVLENVAATEFDRDELLTLARYVEDGGGGLLVTGGRRSFGLGGYHKSPLDPVLPVSLDVKVEHRRARMALAVVLDRSGSMGMTVASGETKMLLANRGTAAAVNLLGPSDQIAIVAVDSAPHIVQAMTRATDRRSLRGRAMSIQAGGGGIYTYSALKAGGRELASSDAATRHMILFADAADAEEPGDYQELLKKFRGAAITVSVVALGSDSDPDAAFLKDVAQRGGGNIYFTDKAEDLPQLFSLDTLVMARSSFIEERTTTTWLGGLQRLGDLAFETAPDIEGYNLTYAREGVAVGWRTVDEYTAPLLAAKQHGLGRVAAVMAEVDGDFTGPLANWDGYGRLLATTVNHLAGREATQEVAASVRREGHTVVVTLELDPEDPASWPSVAPELLAIPEDPNREVLRRRFVFESETTLVARYDLATGTTWHHRVAIDNRTLSPAPVTLPYSPEFELREGRIDGRDHLARLAAITGGTERIDLDGIFENDGRHRRWSTPMALLVALMLALMIGEIAVRRLGLFARRGMRKSSADAKVVVDAATRPDALLAAPDTVASNNDDTKAGRQPDEDPLRALDRAAERSRRRLGK